MANTIRVIEAFEFLREGVRAKSVPQQTYTIATTSELAPMNEQIVGTTHEAIALGDVTDTALCEISVLTDTAVVSVGGDSGGSFVKWFDVQKGDPPARMPRVGTLASTYLKSDTASTIVQVKLIKIVAPA